MEKLSNLPKPVVAGAAVGGGGGLVVAGVAIGSGNWWVFVIVFVIVIAIVLGAFLIAVAWRRKKKSAQLGGQIQQHNSTVRGISDPGQRARLDDMRKKFEQGVSEYRSRGKDLYTLPWYMIVGEPGSGKTEAIRHSNVGFPPGMQDEFQGVGGTINMNWWFTNSAVLLDTAGRLMFEEIKAGETSEWKEFLSLLKRNRPNCPVNGLLLVIPSDSLIKDSAEDIARKAGRIAQQLDVIQRVLDVRFPVFVIVSKCDKVNGFREFFDGLNDPQQQHQIMGWSNPSPLDQPFQPALLDQHLDRVVQRLSRRRMGLLRDPVPEGQDARRVDEVDALYALPHSLSLLAPRLRRYLETIFLAGEWSAKPLFLRGIYFTSSMREGSALDEELANVMGVPVDQLGEGKVWERERAYFLRDLFVEKVFREKGLVTRATNTGQMLRRNKLILFCGGTAALALFIIIAVLSMMNLRSNVEEHSKYWHGVAAVGWQNRTWKQPLIPLKANGAFADAVTNQVTVERPIELARFHSSLRDLAEKDLPRNWFYPGLSSTYAKKSRHAQQVIFDTGVIKPLVDAARQKMARDLSGDPEAVKRFPEALAALIRLEAEAAPAGSSPKKPLTLQAAEGFLRPLWSFVTSQDATRDPAFTNLVGVLVRTYSGSGDAGSLWAPAWLSGSGAQSNVLGNNAIMRANLDALENAVKSSIKGRVDRWNETLKLRDSLADFKKAEEAMLAAAKSGEWAKFDQEYAVLARARNEADAQMQQPRVKEAITLGGSISLSNAYQQFTNELQTAALDILRTVRAPLSQATNQLYLEIAQRLKSIQQQAAESVVVYNPSGAGDQIRGIEAVLLARPGGYAERAVIYSEIMKELTNNPFASARQITRLKTSPLETFQKETLEPLRAKTRDYAGSFKSEFGVISTQAVSRVERVQRLVFLNAYIQEVRGLVKAKSGFPLTKATNSVITLTDFATLKRELSYVVNELKAPVLQGFPFQDSADWKRFAAWVGGLTQVAQALLEDDGTPLKCTVSLRKKDNVADTDDWSFRYYFIQLGGAKDRLRTGSPDEAVLGAISLEQPAELRLFRNVEDNTGTNYPSPAWGAVWLVHQFGKPNQSGTTWNVDRPSNLQAENFKSPLRLKLEFAKPLPSLENWPDVVP